MIKPFVSQMEKPLCSEDADHFNNTRRGCMSGIFHAIDHQFWHSNVKKILLHRKNSKHAKRKDPMPYRKLQRTYSIHHLESDEWVRVNEKETETPVSSKEPEDDVDIISQNLKITQDLDGSKVCYTKAKLTKSGSFPFAYRSGSRNLRPSELKHKLNEFYVSKSNKNLGSLMVEFNKNNNAMPIRRISSFSEFTNRYSQLFDYSRSKSLKLTSDIATQINPVLEEKNQSEFQISEGLKPLCISEEQTKTANDNRFIELSNEQYEDDDYFTYVREILDRSGFIKNGFQQPWHSSNQPLDPSIFQEIESRYLHDPDRFEEELVELSQHLLRFDLVGEALINIYERSFSFYPKALSCSCHFRRAPTGKFVLDEVWTSLTRLVNLKPDSSQSLDSIVARDFGMNDGWMNLQLDSECVALQLEDLIFDELLEEVLHS